MRTALFVASVILLAGNRSTARELPDPPASPYRVETSGSFLLWFLDTANGAAPGLRVSSSGWLGESGLGLELNGFLLGQQTDTHTFDGSSFLTPAAFNARGLKKNAADLTILPVFRSDGPVDHTTELWGAEANPIWRVVEDEAKAIDVITGFRFLRYQETLNVFTASTILTGGGNGPIRFATHERYRTTNNFYGGTIGARMSSGRGALYWDVMGKVGLGGMNQIVDGIGSASLMIGPDQNVALLPGLYPVSGYSLGRRSGTRFAVLPEGDFKVGYQLTAWMNAFVGYSVLYVSSAARPGDQITVAPIPTSPMFSRPTARPAALTEIIDDGLWVHGINFGVTLRY